MAATARIKGRVKDRFGHLALNAAYLSIRTIKLTIRNYLSNQLILNAQCLVISHGSFLFRLSDAYSFSF
ncbi:MAG: hypothetical protein CBD27_10855 [Rhodospirillaceae bacterium TMED167]|nr:MAG: hypothetical protein CBD27_10855 [Rhodospirillaceae bacterium TMED167]